MPLIETDSGPVEYFEQGSGPPVLYFHGTLSGSEIALALERPLVDDGFRLIVPHRPGFYGTPIKQRTSTADCADLAANVLDHLGIDRSAIIGTSAGGPPAIRFAIRHPHRANALVLQCAQVHRWEAPRWGPPNHRALYHCARHSWMRWFLSRSFSTLFRTRLPTPEAYLRDLAGDRFTDLSIDTAIEQLAAKGHQSIQESRLHAEGFRNDMRIFAKEHVLATGRVGCPTLILHDPLDPHSAFRHAEFAASEIPHARLVSLTAGGHSIWAGRDAERMHRIRIAFLKEQL